METYEKLKFLLQPFPELEKCLFLMSKRPNHKKSEIYFELGDCSLSQYIDSKADNFNFLNNDLANNIIYIFKTMTKFVLDF